MTDLLTPAQMRAIEQAAIASGDVTGMELMERAGRGVVAAIFAEWPALQAAPYRAVVLCGPGNNGGDGFVVARLLTEWGWEVEAIFHGDPKRSPPDAAASLARYVAAGGAVKPWVTAAVSALDADLVVDALFGGGLTRALPEDVRHPLAEWQARPGMSDDHTIPLVAVDGPSGICLASGRSLATDVTPLRAALTVTFHRLRVGHCLGDGAANSGKVVVADIGLEAFDNAASAEGRVVMAAPDAPMRRREDANKFGHGHALVLTGGIGRTGAARLAARGALRIGAGLVTLGVPAEALPEVAAQITAVMCAQIDDAKALADRLDDARISALCLGPGMGQARARALVPVCLAAAGVDGTRRGVVLDADALSAFADAPQRLFGMVHPYCVLTPHGGEFSRLFPDIMARFMALPTDARIVSKVDATREAAARAGCVVLFKGSETVIADPEGRCAVHVARGARAAPWLATAGSGDVLAGIITGLLAQGVAPFRAACTAVWIHVEAARAFGPGLIAEDLPEMLPKVLRDLAW